MEKTQILQNSTYNINKKDITAAAYIRVSTPRQKNEGYSTKNQRDLAKKYAEENGWYLPDELIFEENKSASKIYGNDINTDEITENFMNRSIFKRLLLLAEKEQFKHLIVYSRDRLTRVLEEFIALEFFLKTNNIDIHYTRIGENIENENTNINHFINIILSSLTEYESSLLSCRIKDANRTCILDGHWAGGRTPFGYIRQYINEDSTKNKKHSTLIKSDFESPLVNEIFNLYLHGYGYKSISDIMNKKYGFTKWTKSKIEAIIKNQTYTGHIAWNRRGGRRQKFKKYNKIVLSPLIKNADIIDKNTWDKCLNLRNARTENKDPYYYTTNFILKGKLICAKCTKVMGTKNPGKNKSNVYKCAPSKDSPCNCIIPSRKVHYYFAQKIKNSIRIDNYDKLWGIYCEKSKEKKQQYITFAKAIDNEISEYKSFLAKLNYKIPLETNTNILKALKNQKVFISRLIKEFDKTKSTLKKELSIQQMDKITFQEYIDGYIDSILDNFDVETENMDKEYLLKNCFKVREFVLNFIDKIYINCENRSIIEMKIIYKAPESI